MPRTFIGPLFLSAPTALLNKLISLPPITNLYLIRLTLGLFNILSLLSIRNALSSRYSAPIPTLFTLFTLTQFHLLFYASRPLPNTFALPFTNLALAYRIYPPPKHRPYLAILLLSLACALFRSELCLYIFSTLVVDLFLDHLDFLRTFRIGLTTAITTACTSLSIDSYFWNRLSYPEFQVFYFNAVQNKSSAWGIHPFHWYFSNALPRAVGGCLPLALFSLRTNFRSIAPILAPVLIFVTLYSILPHKELRFIFYALPVFNVGAAVAICGAWQRLQDESKSDGCKKTDNAGGTGKGRGARAYGKLVCCGIVVLLGGATLCLSALQTVIATVVSRRNYPGGYAMRAMLEKESTLYQKQGLCENAGELQPVGYVHIDAASAMTGVSQYLEIRQGVGRCPTWTYSKQEGLSDEELVAQGFTHLVTEREHVEGFCIVHVEWGFERVDWRRGRVIETRKTFAMRNKKISQSGCLTT